MSILKLYNTDKSTNYNILTLVNTLQFNHISAKKNATTSLRHVASDVNIQDELKMFSLNKSLEATSFFMKFNNLLKQKQIGNKLKLLRLVKLEQYKS